MALQAYGGPQFTTFRVPVGGQSSKVGANLNVNLIYAFEKGSLTAGYLHGLTGGSGAFTGSTVNQFNFGASRQLSRVWTANFNVGYAHDAAVVNSTQNAFPAYNSWFVGGGVNRPFGKNVNLAVAYTAYINQYWAIRLQWCRLQYQSNDEFDLCESTVAYPPVGAALGSNELLARNTRASNGFRR